MKGKIFIFVGIILIGTGVIVSQSNTGVRINNRMANEEVSKNVRNYIGGGVGGLGLFFVIVGLVGMVRGSKQTKRNQYIMQTGIDAQGTVTFVDKNWSVLVNKNPIYSIVEYTYLDRNGNKYTRRINNLSSEIVIRKQIQVGSNVPIKYSAENPGESVIILMS
jgi:hypothetical protein